MNFPKSFVGSVALLFAQNVLYAQIEQCFPPKDEQRLVYDLSDVLPSDEEGKLETRLTDFAKNTSNQIAVVIVDDLCGYDKSVYATELGEKWGLGQAKEDNGIVLLVKPKTPTERGETFIAVGRGLEGAIPDATAFLIVENELLPSFRQGNYPAGIDSATKVLMALAVSEYNNAEYAARHQRPQKKAPGIGPVFFLLLVIGLFFLIKSFQVRNYARRNGISWWAAWWLINASQSRHKGYWGDFSGGRGGFGGGGGGGFGGFGGGSFGGGGSGGSW